jgi:hypothetical protein
MTRAELENQLVNQIHYLPIEAIETLLKLTTLLKTTHSGLTTEQPSNFADFIKKSPLMGVDIDLSRNPSVCREIEL